MVFIQKKQEPLRQAPVVEQPSKSPSVQLRALAGAGYDKAAAALSPVQMDGGQAMNTNAVHAAAQSGIAGSGGALPHLGAIQMAFGRHDVGNVQAHTGGAAQAACNDMGAQAYASGNAVAFGGTPDLHTAAHEAAHIVQQRAGVSLSGGVGKSGDGYERHADQVADAVVQGKSAEGLLDQYGGAKNSGASVQQKAIQLKGKGGDVKNALKGGATTVSNILPGGALWSDVATGDKTTQTRSRSKDKIKVWALRAGALVGQLAAPMFTGGLFFLWGAIKTWRNNRKKRKDEQRKRTDPQAQQQSQKRDMTDRINQLFDGQKVFDLCNEAGYSYVDVKEMFLGRLGLGGKVPSVWNSEQLEGYYAFETALRQNCPILDKAFNKYGPVEEEQEGGENEGTEGNVIDLDQNQDLGNKNMEELAN